MANFCARSCLSHKCAYICLDGAHFERTCSLSKTQSGWLGSGALFLSLGRGPSEVFLAINMLEFACRTLNTSTYAVGVRSVYVCIACARLQGLSRRLLDGKTHTTLVDVGTYDWCAPEILLYQQASTKSDIFSYGVVLWEIITGKPPQRGKITEPQYARPCLHT